MAVYEVFFGKLSTVDCKHSEGILWCAKTNSNDLSFLWPFLGLIISHLLEFLWHWITPAQLILLP